MSWRAQKQKLALNVIFNNRLVIERRRQELDTDKVGLFGRTTVTYFGAFFDHRAAQHKANLQYVAYNVGAWHLDEHATLANFARLDDDVNPVVS